MNDTIGGGDLVIKGRTLVGVDGVALVKPISEELAVVTTEGGIVSVCGINDFNVGDACVIVEAGAQLPDAEWCREVREKFGPVVRRRKIKGIQSDYLLMQMTVLPKAKWAANPEEIQDYLGVKDRKFETNKADIIATLNRIKDMADRAKGKGTRKLNKLGKAVSAMPIIANPNNHFDLGKPKFLTVKQEVADYLGIEGQTIKAVPVLSCL